MEIKFRLYIAGEVQIEIVGYQKWNEKLRHWQYSTDNQKWNKQYIEHSFKDMFLGVSDSNDIQLYQNDIVTCNTIEEEDGEEIEEMFVISYCEQLCTYILISPCESIAEPLYMTGADILTKVGCMHIDYTMFKEFGVGSKKIKK